MTTTVELVRFRVRPDQVDAMLAARPAMEAEFRAHRAGFLGVRLVDLGDGQWLDVVEWRAAADLDASRATAPTPGVAAFFATIDEVLADERGTTAAV